MEVRPWSLVLLALCILSHDTCITGAVPSCTNYRPIKHYGTWCFKYPLLWAAQAGDLAEVTKLISDGADVNTLTNPGRWTALHFAANYGRANIVDLLLKNGANALIANRDNHTARHRAQAKYCKSHRANASCDLANYNYYRTIKLLDKAIAEQKKKITE